MTWSVLLWKSSDFGGQISVNGQLFLQKKVAKRQFLKNLSLECCTCIYSCTAVTVECIMQLCHIITGWKYTTFVCLIFTFWHVCAITCSVTVGLEYVTEIQVIGQSPRYHCELCDSKFDHNLKFPHLVGSKHRFNVLVSSLDLWNSKFKMELLWFQWVDQHESSLNIISYCLVLKSDGCVCLLILNSY